MIFTLIPGRRGLLIGLTCGVLLGVALNLLVPEAELGSLSARIAGVFAMGVVGALLGGFVCMTGWLTSVGGVMGLIIVGTLCDVATHQSQVVMYGTFLGAAIGGFVGYAFGTRLEWALAQIKGDPVHSSGVWDREFDG
jgi:hypothetical protein